MRIELELDGRKELVELDLAAGTATVGGIVVPVKVLSDSPERIELEIAGEKRTIEGWAIGTERPAGPVTLDGERYRVSARVSGGSGGAGAPAASAAPVAEPGPIAPAAAAAAGTIAPPMPGKVVEVRVAEGETVRAGQVLLVLEAMKMRNEVVAPTAGIVRELSARPGANVRAREPMLRIEPA